MCQDFVHLGLCLLRHHGIAARYVSGYLFASGPATRQESVEVDTHAWLEALLPVPGGGEPVWVGADPTNRGIAGEDHVKIGHGRHYADVPPTKGVYRGTATATLDASVTMTRLDGVDPASIAQSAPRLRARRRDRYARRAVTSTASSLERTTPPARSATSRFSASSWTR